MHQMIKSLWKRGLSADNMFQNALPYHMLTLGPQQEVLQDKDTSCDQQ